MLILSVVVLGNRQYSVNEVYIAIHSNIYNRSGHDFYLFLNLIKYFNYKIRKS